MVGVVDSLFTAWNTLYGALSDPAHADGRRIPRARVIALLDGTAGVLGLLVDFAGGATDD